MIENKILQIKVKFKKYLKTQKNRVKIFQIDFYF